MIEKKLHYVWIQGEDNLPQQYKDRINTLRSEFPTWNIKVWDDTQIQKLCSQYSEKLLDKYNNLQSVIDNSPSSYKPSLFTLKSDIARNIILYYEGGYYSDIDLIFRYKLYYLNDISNYNIVIGYKNVFHTLFIYSSFFGVDVNNNFLKYSIPIIENSTIAKDITYSINYTYDKYKNDYNIKLIKFGICENDNDPKNFVITKYTSSWSKTRNLINSFVCDTAVDNIDKIFLISCLILILSAYYKPIIYLLPFIFIDLLIRSAKIKIFDKNKYNLQKLDINSLKNGDIIILGKTKERNFRDTLIGKLKAKLLNTDFYHAIIVHKKDNKTYAVDFAKSDYFINYYKIPFTNGKYGLRLIELDRFLNAYNNVYEPVLNIYSCKYSVELDIYEFTKKYKECKFSSFSRTTKLFINKKYNFNFEINNNDELFCTQIPGIVLQELGYLDKNYDIRNFMPDEYKKLETLTNGAYRNIGYYTYQ